MLDVARDDVAGLQHLGAPCRVTPRSSCSMPLTSQPPLNPPLAGRLFGIPVSYPVTLCLHTRLRRCQVLHRLPAHLSGCFHPRDPPRETALLYQSFERAFQKDDLIWMTTIFATRRAWRAWSRQILHRHQATPAWRQSSWTTREDALLRSLTHPTLRCRLPPRAPLSWENVCTASRRRRRPPGKSNRRLRCSYFARTSDELLELCVPCFELHGHVAVLMLTSGASSG